MRLLDEASQRYLTERDMFASLKTLLTVVFIVHEVLIKI
jgi:hypothetical protein